MFLRYPPSNILLQPTVEAFHLYPILRNHHIVRNLHAAIVNNSDLSLHVSILQYLEPNYPRVLMPPS